MENKNYFEKFVDLHNKWRVKKIVYEDKSLCVYDWVFSGGILLIIIVWYLSNFKTASLIIPILIFIRILTYVEFIKKEKE